jgi:hypothetical protein
MSGKPGRAWSVWVAFSHLPVFIFFLFLLFSLSFSLHYYDIISKTLLDPHMVLALGVSSEAAGAAGYGMR